MKPLRVVEVHGKDVLGARTFDLAPGKITIFKGRNGTGKSTALALLQAALGGGNLSKIARVPAAGEPEAEPEVVLVLEGEGNEAFRIKRKGDKVDVRERVGDTAAFKSVGKPQSWLTSLFDPKGANPVAFLTAKDADRGRMLLEALPLTMDRAALLAEMDVETSETGMIPDGLHPLAECAFIRDHVFNTRTGINRDRDAKRKAADQTRRNSPAVIPDDPEKTIAGLQAEVEALARDLGTRETAARSAHDAAVEKAITDHKAAEAATLADFKAVAKGLRALHAEWAAEERAKVERAIAEKATEVEAEIAARKEQDEDHVAELDAARDAAVNAAHAAHVTAEGDLAAIRNTLAAKREQLSALRVQAENATKARALHDQAKQFDDEADALDKDWARLTAAIEAVDRFSRSLADSLPIPGLEIDEEGVRVRGVPYEQLNMAQKVDIAVQVACLRAKGSKLPVVFVDGAETLDDENFRILVDRLEAENVQAFLARVEPHDFEVVKA